MSKTSGVVQINGNQYDAATGQLLNSIQKVVHLVKPTPTGVIDGFTRTSANRKLRGTAQQVHKRAQHSKTLMRQAVAKPKTAKDNHSPNAHKVQGTSIDFTRHHRAKSIVQHTKVKHFGVLKQSHSGHHRAHEARESVADPKSQSLVLKPKVAASAVQPLPSMVTSASHQHLERLLDQALIRADAHKKQLNSLSAAKTPWQKIKRLPRWASIGSALAIVLVLFGFFAWQNIPQVAMRVAAARAHVNAAVPAYTPSGFSFAGPITSSGSSVTMKFKAAGDASRTFAINQQASTWDSKSLAANTISKDSQVQTSQIKGTTVYIYGSKNNASWVNHGVRYTLTDHANLNSDQILRIADSL